MCEKSGWIHGAIRVSRCRILGIFFPAKPTSTHTYGRKAWISVSGHETRSTGSPNSGKTPVDRVSCPDTEIWVFSECEFPWTGFHLRVRTWNLVHGNLHSGITRISVSGHETRSTGQIDVLLFLPRVQFTQNHPIFTRNWMIEFECNEFVLVLFKLI